MSAEYYRTVTFPNGYGASIVSHEWSYGGKDGLFEVAVLRDGDIVYDTPITDDTVGWCDFDRVAELLQQIKALPAAALRW